MRQLPRRPCSSHYQILSMASQMHDLGKQQLESVYHVAP